MTIEHDSWFGGRHARRGPLLVAVATMALTGLGACNPQSAPGGDETESGGGDGIVSIGGSDETASTGGNDSLDTFDPDESGSTSGGPGLGLNCTEIDFVFVVDNSSSMADEQQHLVDAVPGFVEAMQTALPTVQGFRVGVTDTDTYPGLGAETPLDGCPDTADCESCDYTLGAFLSKPASAVDPETSCNFSTGTNYMDGQSETFADEFACAAIVGTDGNPVEQQAAALVEAVSTPLNKEGSCNEGFVRDEALLVFLLITDEEDRHTDPPAPQGGSQGDPQRWYDAVVEAKDGKATNVVALGLLGGSPRFPDCEDLSQGNDGAEQSTRLQQFIQKFPTHFVGSVCSNGYDAFFREALEKVAEGCMNFIP